MSDNVKRAKEQSKKMVRAINTVLAHAESVADNATTDDPVLIRFNDWHLPNPDVVSSELKASGFHSKPAHKAVKIFGRNKK